MQNFFLPTSKQVKPLFMGILPWRTVPLVLRTRRFWMVETVKKTQSPVDLARLRMKGFCLLWSKTWKMIGVLLFLSLQMQLIFPMVVSRTFWKILQEWHVCTRWVHCTLTEQQKGITSHMGANMPQNSWLLYVRGFYILWENCYLWWNMGALLWHKSKQQSSVWKHPSSPLPVKALIS